MTITQNYGSVSEVAAYVTGRGYNWRPLMREGTQEVTGIRLIGPRRNSSTELPHPERGYDLDMVKLWCDGVDYATKKLAERRGSK